MFVAANAALHRTHLVLLGLDDKVVAILLADAVESWSEI
jgi:hypothetical protein